MHNKLSKRFYIKPTPSHPYPVMVAHATTY